MCTELVANSLAQTFGVCSTHVSMYNIRLSGLPLEFPLPNEMKHGKRGKNIFIARIEFFWLVPVLKKSLKNYFGGRFLPAALAEKWCPALYQQSLVRWEARAVLNERGICTWSADQSGLRGGRRGEGKRRDTRAR